MRREKPEGRIRPSANPPRPLRLCVHASPAFFEAQGRQALATGVVASSLARTQRFYLRLLRPLWPQRCTSTLAPAVSIPPSPKSPTSPEKKAPSTATNVFRLRLRRSAFWRFAGLRTTLARTKRKTRPAGLGASRLVRAVARTTESSPCLIECVIASEAKQSGLGQARLALRIESASLRRQ